MTSHSDFLSNSISGESRVSSTEGVGVENRQSMEGARDRGEMTGWDIIYRMDKDKDKNEDKGKNKTLSLHATYPPSPISSSVSRLFPTYDPHLISIY